MKTNEIRLIEWKFVPVDFDSNNRFEVITNEWTIAKMRRWLDKGPMDLRFDAELRPLLVREELDT